MGVILSFWPKHLQPERKEKNSPELDCCNNAILLMSLSRSNMSCNYNPPPLLEDEGAMMRGDAVGSTMYSERWILKILMQLTKLVPEDWNSDLENEMCVLWDMSAEEDVVHLLMQHNMFSLATHIIMNLDKCRLTEIMVGIIGNMCCIESVRTELGNRSDVVEVLIELLSTPDVPTLLQVLRVLQTCAWDVKKTLESYNQEPCAVGRTGMEKIKAIASELDTTDVRLDESDVCNKGMLNNPFPISDISVETEVFENKSVHSEIMCHTRPSEEFVEGKETKDNLHKEIGHPWLKHFMEIDSWRSKILFILSSSKHDELISCTWSFLSTVCYIPIGRTVFSQKIIDTDLMVALLESYKEVFEESFKTYETNDIEPVKKAASHWVSVLYSFTLHKEGVDVICQFRADVISCLFNMLHYCHSVLTVDEELTSFITSSVAILDVMFSADPHEWSHFTSGLLSTIKLWEELSEAKSVKCKENQNSDSEEEAMKALEEFFSLVYKWLEEKKTDDNFNKFHLIHKQLSQLLNSRIT